MDGKGERGSNGRDKQRSRRAIVLPRNYQERGDQILSGGIEKKEETTEGDSIEPMSNTIWTQRTKEKEGEVNKYFSLISLNSLSVLLYLSYVHDRKIVQKDNKQYSPRMVSANAKNV